MVVSFSSLGCGDPFIPVVSCPVLRYETSVASERDAVWRKTQEEVTKGLMHGPFTREEMDAAYGRGRWRPMQRFGVWQRGKLRACDRGC